jgi:two-component system, sensor histidine kinase and response regulator
MKILRKSSTDLSRFIQIFTGTILVILGLSVVIGWHTKNTTLLTIFPSFAPMVYNTALCFALCGITFLLGVTAFRRVAVISATIVIMVGGLTMIEYLTGLNFGLDQFLMGYYVDFPAPHPGRMALTTAICFTLAGIAFLLNSTKSGWRSILMGIIGAVVLIAGILGAIVAILLTIAVTGYLMKIPTAYSWGIFSVMALHTAFGLVCLGGGIIAQTWQDDKLKAKDSLRWLPILVSLGMAAMSINFYFALHTQRQITTQQAITGHVEKLEYAIENGVKERVLALERMAGRWSQRGGTPFEEWQSDAQNYNQHFKTFQALEWADAKFYVRWLEPLNGNETILNFNLTAEEKRRIALESAMHQRKTIISQTVELKQGGQGILIYVPVYRGREFDGFIIGVSRIETLFKAIIPEDLTTDYVIKIVEDNREIFHNELINTPDKQWHDPRIINLSDVVWQINIAPRPATLTKFDSLIPEASLVAGLLASLLIGGTVYLLQKSRREIVERIRAEKQLSQSKEYLRETSVLQETILNSANYTIISTLPDGTIKAFNKTAEEWLGYKAEEVIGQVTPAIIHDSQEVIERAQELSEQLGKKIEPGFEAFVALTRYDLVDEREWTYIRKDGSRLPVLLSISAMRDEKGEITGFLGISSDITIQKQSEKALRESERRYRDLTEKSLGLICTHDLNGVLLSVNSAAANAIGYTQTELIGRSLTDLLQPEAKPFFKDYLHTIKQDGEFSGQMNMLTKSGEKRVWQFKNTFYKEADADVYILGHAQDVTENVEIADDLRESRALFEQFMNNSPAMIFMKDEQGNYEFINHPLEDLFGVKLKDLRGKDDFSFIPANVAGIVRENDRIVLETNKTLEALELVPTPDGVPHYWQSFKFPVTTRAGKRFVGGVAFDVTETKKLTTELEKAYDAALESARIKSEFLANMSHEIRTPMNGVIGMTELLLTTNLSAEQFEFAKTIKTSGDLLLNIINDILDFSKIEAGRLNLEIIDFDLRQTVESVIEIFAKAANQKNVEIVSYIENRTITDLRGDPSRLRQILNNLVGNAVKFTKAGEVIVKVETEAETETVVNLRFTVTDTGIGIDSEIQSQLFQSFKQADGSTTRKYGGTGLGLAISKQLVELMNGEIGVESAPDRGSTFWFTIPFEKQLVTTQTPIFEPTNLNNLRLLIVDDNATNRKILNYQSADWGILAVEAESGAVALNLLRAAAAENRPFAIAILDLMMPDMDGFTLAGEIKKDKLIASTRLILMPSFGDRQPPQHAQPTDIAAYLVKPVRQADFYDCLASVMGAIPSATAPNLVTANHTLEKTILTDKANGPRILIVEDSEINQKVILGYLKHLGLTADVVSDGQQALDILAQKDYTLVLMDCQMPVLDGYSATAEIRRRETSGKHLPVIALTANAMQGVRERCLAAGMDDYLSKPIEKIEFAETIRRWLNQNVDETPAKLDTDMENYTSQSTENTVSQRLKELFEICGAQTLVEIIELFLAKTVERLDSLKNAATNGDMARLNSEVHTLKGSSANVGAKSMADLCEIIEMTNAVEITPQLSKTVTQLLADFARLKPQFETEKQFYENQQS